MSKSNLIRGNIKAILAVQVSVDLPSVGAATTVNQTIAVAGAKTGDMVFASILNNPTAGYFLGNAWVSATDVVTVRLGNTTAGALDPGVVNINLLIVQPEYMLSTI